MIRVVCSIIIALMFDVTGIALSQEIREYEVRRTLSPILIDGNLSEPEWDAALLTETFVIYTDGSSPVYPTRAKMLWDDEYLYVAFLMTDKDVWGEMASWNIGNKCLCSEEVAEVFIDPDSDGVMYLETEVNPLGTVMDLSLDKEFAQGGKANYEWNFDGLKIGIGVDGTLNNPGDVDTKWVCELAFPFSTMAFSAPSMHFPPINGDAWRLNLYRYEYFRDGSKNQELTAWNQTDKRGFHAPDKFGRIIFSASPVLSPATVNGAESSPYMFGITGNYPNPFNLSTTISFTLPSSGNIELDLYSVLGQHCRTLVSGMYSSGIHTVLWDGTDAAGAVMTSGVYILRLWNGKQSVSHAMLLVK